MSNSRLLDAAEEHGFDVLVTGDKKMQFQQDLRYRKIALLVLSNPKWPDVRLSVSRILDAIEGAKPGTAALVECVAGP